MLLSVAQLIASCSLAAADEEQTLPYYKTQCLWCRGMPEPGPSAVLSVLCKG